MRNRYISPHSEFSHDAILNDSNKVPAYNRSQTSLGIPQHSSFSSQPYSHPNHSLPSNELLSPERHPVNMPQSPLPATQTSAHSYAQYAEPGNLYPSVSTHPNLIPPYSQMEMTSLEESSCPRCRELTSLVKSLEKKVQVLMVQIEKPIYLNGTLIWNISEVSKIKKSSPNIFLESSVFYTSNHGYKLQGCVYLNGDGEAKGKWISVYITLLKGEFDGLLNWPFLFPVTIVLVDQSCQGLEVSKTFQPTRTSSCFRQPLDNIKRPSGLPDFFELSKLRDPYLVDDTMYLKFIVHITE